jgi:hypothetical protein
MEGAERDPFQGALLATHARPFLILLLVHQSPLLVDAVLVQVVKFLEPVLELFRSCFFHVTHRYTIPKCLLFKTFSIAWSYVHSILRSKFTK